MQARLSWYATLTAISCCCYSASFKETQVDAPNKLTAEDKRLEESRDRKSHWKRWGPYLSERAWGTVREDYSANGTAWEFLPHDHARSKAYRWNEDGIAGICDRHQHICFALALWNEKDPFLKERLFGLTGNEGNRGPEPARLHLLPTIWFRNTWSWTNGGMKPSLERGPEGLPDTVINIEHPNYGKRYLYCENKPAVLFTENETNKRRLY